jgi:hypothetical protein
MIIDRNIAYLGSIYPHHVENDIQEIAGMGCTSINMTVNEMDWFYYRRARNHIIASARRHGLKVYLNLHGFGMFASPIPSGYFQMEHAECRQFFNTGVPGGNLCCPNNKIYKQWLMDVVTEMLDEFKPDGVFWDEPRFAVSKDFPEIWACRCSNCQEKYFSIYNSEMPQVLTDNVISFRQDSLLEFLQDMLDLSKSRSNAENVLCLMSIDRNQNASSLIPGWYGVVEWEPFAQMRNLDVFSTDPYWIHEKTFEYFTDNASRAIELAYKYNKKSQIWVQAVWIEPGKEQEVGRTIRAVKQLGADMLAVWSFKCEQGSSVLYRGGDQEKVWQIVKEAYLEGG